MTKGNTLPQKFTLLVSTEYKPRDTPLKLQWEDVLIRCGNIQQTTHVTNRCLHTEISILDKPTNLYIPLPTAKLMLEKCAKQVGAQPATQDNMQEYIQPVTEFVSCNRHACTSNTVEEETAKIP